MSLPIPCRALARVLTLVLLALAGPLAARGQSDAPDPADLGPEVQAGLARAAGDARLDPWQRDYMLRLAGADGAWDSAAVRPSARANFSAIYDPVRERLLVFGGDDNGYAKFGDVWELALAGEPTWTQLVTTGTPPGGRTIHGTIYEPVRDRMVIFGGSDSTGLLDEVWGLSLSGTPAWTQLVPAGTPPTARGSFSAIHDPLRDRMVVFGGFDDHGYLGDVWALSLSGTPAWTRLTPTGTPPSVRWGHSAIHDPLRDRMLVFGGYLLGGQEVNEVWALSLGDAPAWAQLTPAGTPPSVRCEQSAIYDPVRDRMLVFGGVNPFLNDVWELSLAGAPAWTELAPTGTLPGERASHGAVYDPVRDRMVVFGGIGYTYSTLNDAWSLSLADAPAWTQLTPPAARYIQSAIHDPVRDRMVVFGGRLYSTYFDDVWSLSLTDAPAWAPLAPVGTPPSARYSHSAIYDPVRDRMIVFGGYRPYLNDVWELSLAGTPAWTQLAPTGTPPGPRAAHSAIYDPVRDRMVVFAGYEYSVGAFNDVWELSLSGTPTWTQLAPAGTPPDARRYASAIYDPGRDRMVVFGGYGMAYLNDVWELSLSGTPAWTQLAPTGTPPSPRTAHTAVYDVVRDRMVVFGGCGSGYLNDAWALSLSGTPAWTQLAPAGAPPPVRGYHSAIYDPAFDRMVTFGGWGSAYMNDVWLLTWGEPVVPVQLALVSAEAEPGLVRLAWYAASGPVSATVYRRTETTDWSAVGTVTSDGTGRLLYEDRAVSPGTRYGYRLRVSENGTETYLGEAWVDVPVAYGLSLAGVRPNPASSELAVAFSLPDYAPARLEAFDLAGRQVAMVDVGALGAGSHVVKLGEGARLGCGVYVVRLTQGARTLTTRAVIVR
jgi:hypothetical protein